MTAPGDVTAVFGRQVRTHRTARGWTLRAMAPLAGLRPSALHRIESGESTTLATAGRIAAALGVPLAVLVTEAECGHCLGAPPAGGTCRECGAAGPAVTG
jgi:transcriptional regulator with XRE-family HTH domain